MLFAGSETGMIELNEKKILTKGRLGPGEIIGVRIEKEKFFRIIKLKIIWPKNLNILILKLLI